MFWGLESLRKSTIARFYSPLKSPQNPVFFI
jgi:hypothetical protein